MAAITGAWRQKAAGLSPEATELKWGNGWNPIHAQRDGEGRNIAPNGTNVLVPAHLVDEFAPEYETVDEDSCSTIYGYGFETGTADRPPLDLTNDVDTRQAVMPLWPSWGRKRAGRPGGEAIRSIEKGAVLGDATKLRTADPVQGWTNKDTSFVLDAETSDPSQYEIQTSMVQRDKTRYGSQISGTDSEYDAPIKSRIPGMRLRRDSRGERAGEMLPKSQDEVIRPFWLRTAGTGYRDWMEANQLNPTTPVQRTPPTDPSLGPESPDIFVGHGWVNEDITW